MNLINVKFKIIFFLILVFGIFGLAKRPLAATINVANCSNVDVNVAVAAANSGDTVIVPPGSCTWSSGVTIPDNKKITLQGAGKTSTVITMRSTGLAVQLGSSGSRVTGFGFVEGTLNANGTGFRIDHCSLSFAAFRTGISTEGSGDVSAAVHAAGLIDNNDFNRMTVEAPGTYCMLTDGYCGANQNILWAVPPDFGGANAVYVEHNTYTSDVFGNAVDSNYGGRYVFRFNTINNSGSGPNSGLYIEAHGSQGYGRAPQSWEIYNNTVSNSGGFMWTPMYLRGGTGIVFNNTVTGNWTLGGRPVLDNQRSYRTDLSYPPGDCDGTSDWDQNASGQGGYACRDQIGYGYDAVQWHCGVSGPCDAWNQVRMPAYLWNNKDGSNKELPSYPNDGGKNHVVANRDYYEYSASFTGASGVGSGPLANRPPSCTTQVGYWATDQGSWNTSGSGGQGVLYKCTTTNTWTLYYTPYTYPHPLQGLIDITPPGAPTGLAVQ